MATIHGYDPPTDNAKEKLADFFFKKEAGIKITRWNKCLRLIVYMQKSSVSKGILLLNIILTLTSKTV